MSAGLRRLLLQPPLGLNPRQPEWQSRRCWPPRSDRARVAGFSFRFRRAHGFSLLEVLVAVTLLTFIITGLTVMFAETRRVIRRGTNQVEIMDGARATMGMLAQMLQQTVPSQRPDLVNLDVRQVGATFPQALPGSGGTRFNFLQNIFALARSGDQWGMSKFGFADNDPATGSGVGTLYLRTSNTWWQTPQFLASTNEALRLMLTNDPAYRRVIEGVVHLSVAPYDADGHLMTNGTIYTFFDSNLPASVEVELGILDRETLAELRAYAGWNLPNRTTVTNFLAARPEKIHVFRQRVPIHAINRIVP